MVLGIDGCQEGWVGVTLDDEGCYHGIATAPILHDLLRSFPDTTVAGVDMPLHLTNAATRPADTAARKLLGAQRGRSVFPAPPKFVISPDWIDRDPGEVSDESRRRHSCGIPRQSLVLRAKIQEINQAFNDGFPVIEVHPELSFATMNADAPLAFRKKSWGGMRERLALLRDAGIHLPDTLPDAVARLASDDVIDAAAAAWSAHRHARGEATPLPNAPATLRSPVIWS
jgi:predicted RNase H-like nuclease